MIPPPTWTRLPADLVSGVRWIDGSGVVRVELRDGWWTVARDGTRWLEEGEAVEAELRGCVDLPWRHAPVANYFRPSERSPLRV